VAPIPLWANRGPGRTADGPSSASAELQSQWLPRGVVAGRGSCSPAALADRGQRPGQRQGPGRSRVVASPRKEGRLQSCSGNGPPAVPYAPRGPTGVLVPDDHAPDGGYGHRRGRPTCQESHRSRGGRWTTNREVHPHLHFDKLGGKRGRPVGRGRPGPGAMPCSPGCLRRALDPGLCALPGRGGPEAALAQTGRVPETPREQVRQAAVGTFPGHDAPRRGPPPIDTEGHPGSTLWQAAPGGSNHGPRRRPSRGRSPILVRLRRPGQRVVHATPRHLQRRAWGPTVDYPVHRYFLCGAKQIELLFGIGIEPAWPGLGRQLVADLPGRGRRFVGHDRWLPIKNCRPSECRPSECRPSDRGSTAGTRLVCRTCGVGRAGSTREAIPLTPDPQSCPPAPSPSRDYQDVHHDPELGPDSGGSKDIFMNILNHQTDWSAGSSPTGPGPGGRAHRRGHPASVAAQLPQATR